MLINFFNLIVNKLGGKPRFFKIMSGEQKGLYIYMALRHGMKKVLGIYEPELSKILKKLILKGNTSVDVGAHVGYLTLLMAKLVGQQGTVLAIEPLQENCGYLQKSLDKNKFSNTQILQIGLGSEKTTGTAHVFSDSNMVNFINSGYVNYKKDTSEKNFDIDTLDNVFNGKSLDLIKIDVEGYEGQVLEGARKTILKHKPKIIVEIHNLENFSKVIGLLNAAGYEFYDLDFNKFDKKSEFSKLTHLVAIPKNNT